MPIIASAKKKMRQDKKTYLVNQKIIHRYKQVIKKARLHPAPKTLQAAYSALDIASKRGVIHDNKAARLKSALAKKINKFNKSAKSA